MTTPHTPGYAARDDYEEDFTDGFSSPETDIAEALALLEHALSLLAYMGSDLRVDELTSTLNKCYQLLDRKYADLGDYDQRDELDFSSEGDE